MSENRRMSSIARRFSRAWLGELFWTYFWLDFVLVVLSLACLVYTQEKAVFAQDWGPGIERSLKVDSALRGWDWLMSAVLSFRGPDGVWHDIVLKDFADGVRPFALALLWFEGISWFFSIFAMRKRARRLLRPLDQMAQAARELSAKQRAQESRGFDDEKVHDLEAALGRLSQPGEQLHMGDRELAGLEEAINSLLKRMHESYQQQARFVSDASHELRTPIAVIQGYANLLSRWGKQDEKVLEESIAALKSEADYMKKLVEQLLFLARGDIGKNKLDMRPLSLADLMRDVYEDCRLIDAAHEYQLQCEEGVRAVGDADMLKQCARIFTDNAVKYTPEGGTILLRAYQNAAGEACFAVQDSGIGIPPEDVKHVFERFYRADPARSRNSGGTGLGLSIAQWIVSRHGGHIEVLSREGLGTRFTVCLRAEGESER